MRLIVFNHVSLQQQTLIDIQMLTKCFKYEIKLYKDNKYQLCLLETTENQRGKISAPT